MRRLPLSTASVVALACVFTLLVAGADLAALTDGSDHGDPPFLIESGWKPLLNGKNLDGWEFVDPGKKGKWLVTSGVVWGGTLDPAIRFANASALAPNIDRIAMAAPVAGRQEDLGKYGSSGIS